MLRCALALQRGATVAPQGEWHILFAFTFGQTQTGKDDGGHVGSSAAPSSDFWLPALFVLTLPELHGIGVLTNVAVLRIALQGSAGVVGDVAQMAEQRALVALLDFGVERHALANRGQ